MGHVLYILFAVWFVVGGIYAIATFIDTYFFERKTRGNFMFALGFSLCMWIYIPIIMFTTLVNLTKRI